MELERLMSRYFRLRQELSIAYRAQPWNSTRIDRLADDIADAERRIASLQPAVSIVHPSEADTHAANGPFSPQRYSIGRGS
jgi:hypothetical protein